MRTGWADAPLVAFTAAATTGAGILLARPLMSLLGLASLAGGTGESSWGGGLIALGLLLALGHLGRAERMGQALRGLFRSALSNEVALASLCIAAALARIVAGDDGSVAAGALYTVSGLVAACFLVSLGQVYGLAGQRSWGGSVRLTPLILGLAFGVTFGLGTGRYDRAVATACLTLLGLDAGLLATHAWRTLRLDGPFAPAHGWLFARGPSLLALRLVLVNGAPVALLGLGQETAALVVLAGGVLVDRVAFYGLAAQQTTESELGNVEAGIEAEFHRERRLRTQASAGRDRSHLPSGGDSP